MIQQKANQGLISFYVPQSFDDLLLMKSGGRIIFNGALGLRSSALVAYFQVRNHDVVIGTIYLVQSL